jgi:hypothetical protein
MMLKLGTVFALCLPSLSASAETPKVLSPKPGAVIPINEEWDVQLAPRSGVALYHCTVKQGENKVTTEAAGYERQPKCEFGRIENLDAQIVGGPATLQVTLEMRDHTESTIEQPIQIKGREIRAYTGRKFDSHYWANIGGGRGRLAVKEATVKNGVLSIPVFVGAYSFGKVQAKVEADGTIPRQTIRLPKARLDPKRELSKLDSIEAEATREVTLLGEFFTDANGRGMKLTINGAQMNGDLNYTSAKLYRDDSEGVTMHYGCNRARGECPD